MTGDSLIRDLGRRFRDRPAWELVILTAAALSWLYLLIITSANFSGSQPGRCPSC